MYRISRLGCAARFRPPPCASLRHAHSSGRTGARAWGRVGRTAAIAAGVGGGVYLVDTLNGRIVSRSARAVYVLLWVAYQYSNPRGFATPHDLHEAASERLLHMIECNKGLYIKIGQAIANQGTLFPVEYQRRFNRLYDNAPTDSWAHVDALLRANLGADYEDRIFAEIEHTPVASASIAQVHRARLRGGQEVAVKVQHFYIDKQIGVDLLVYRFITKVYERIFGIPMAFFSSYVSTQLRKEVDFVHEEHNSARLAALIARDRALDGLRVRVPRVYSQCTTRQVLVSEWIEGTSLSDRDLLVERGFDLALVMRQYLTSLGRQIFHYGVVHSDPHPGNLIARRDAAGRQELVFLDHGLYVDLSEDFRRQYAVLFKSVFQFDRASIKRIADEWGIKSVELFATLVQLRPVKFSEGDASPPQDVNDLLRDFLDDESKFPLELIFLSRTMRMMQNLNQQFGSPVNRITVLARQSVSSLLDRRTSRWGYCAQWLRSVPVAVALWLNDVAFWLVRLRQLLVGDRYGDKKLGLEDYMEVYMKNTARSIGMEVD
ncbi:ABC1 atypical kinase-like domain-containing protein [[Candida] zeylanoides]